MSGVGDYTISTDKSLLDVDVIHAFLAASYWSPGVARVTVERAIEGSMCFGLYHQAPGVAGREQVGFARSITDSATFAYLADVFVVETHRGRGLSKMLMRTILEHPELQGLRRVMLLTRDAQGLYEQFGFEVTATPGRVMERRDAGWATNPRWLARPEHE